MNSINLHGIVSIEQKTSERKHKHYKDTSYQVIDFVFTDEEGRKFEVTAFSADNITVKHTTTHE